MQGLPPDSTTEEGRISQFREEWAKSNIRQMDSARRKLLAVTGATRQKQICAKGISTVAVLVSKGKSISIREGSDRRGACKPKGKGTVFKMLPSTKTRWVPSSHHGVKIPQQIQQVKNIKNAALKKYALTAIDLQEAYFHNPI